MKTRIIAIMLIACLGLTACQAPASTTPTPTGTKGTEATDAATPDASAAPDATSAPLGAEATQKLYLDSGILLQQLANGDYDDVAAKFDEPMKAKGNDAAWAKDTWETILAMVDYQGYEKAFEGEIAQLMGYNVAVVGGKFGDKAVKFFLSFNDDGLVGGIEYDTLPALPEGITYIDIGDAVAVKPYTPPERDMPPAGVKESSVSFQAQPGYPITGTFTCPENITGIPIVVMVHDSGKNDQNESVGPNKMFRDIAWGLAQKGIASVRYDKITLTHGDQLDRDPNIDTFDADREVILDALGAVQWAKERPEADTGRIYLLGHGLGASLVPEIDERGADTKGFILMAGSPRKLWEVMGDQYAALIDTYEKAGRDKADIEKLRTMLADELAKGAKLKDMSDEDALKETIFDGSAWYMRSLERIDATRWIQMSGKPTLVQQGGRDFQIRPDKDYEAYKAALSVGNANVTYELYPELSHIFGKYEGQGAGTEDEYLHKQPVDPQVIEDIARFIVPQP